MPKVIDFHAHLPVEGLDRQFTEYYARYSAENGPEKAAAILRWGEEYDRQWREAWGYPDPDPPLPPEEAARRWHEEALTYDLERIVFVTGGGNETLSAALAPYQEKLTGFAHHPPEDEDSALQLEEAVTRCGLKGYKIFAPLVYKPLADPSFRAIWETAESFNLPVLIHFGILGGGGGIASGANISPLSLEPVAKAHPTIPFVVPHFGCGYVRDLLQLSWACANVYVDTSGNNEWTRWHPYPLTLQDLFRRFHETVGPKRIIFGSDSSWFPRGFARRYLDDQLRACLQLGLSAEAIDLIFSGNARRILQEVRHG